MDRFPKSPVAVSGTVLDVRTIVFQNCEAIPRRARIEGSWTCVSLNSRLEIIQEDEEETEHDRPCRSQVLTIL